MVQWPGKTGPSRKLFIPELFGDIKKIMKQERINYLLVGLFTLGMLVLLMVVLYRITGTSSDADPYYVHYSNITGIKIGSAVSYGGYQIGQVAEVSPVRKDGKTHYRLKLALLSGWKIPKGSVARIISPGMLADKQIDIQEAVSDQYLKPGDQMQGKEEVSIMTVLNSVAYEIKDVSDKSIKPFIDSLRTHVDAIGKDISSKMPEMTNNLNRLLKQLNVSADSIQDILKKENRENITRMLKNMDTFAANMNGLSKDFSAARDQLDKLLSNSNALVQENRKDLRRTVQELRNTLDTVSQSINSIVYNLETTARNMNEFSRQIRENPGLLLGGSAPKDRNTGKGTAP